MSSAASDEEDGGGGGGGNGGGASTDAGGAYGADDAIRCVAPVADNVDDVEGGGDDDVSGASGRFGDDEGDLLGDENREDAYGPWCTYASMLSIPNAASRSFSSPDRDM